MEAGALRDVLRGILLLADETGDLDVPAAAADAWPEGAAVALVASGLLARGTTASEFLCDGCEQGCWVRPEPRRRKSGALEFAHFCEHDEEIGYVWFPPDRLVTWRLDLGALVRALASSLSLGGDCRELHSGRIWRLGERRQGRSRYSVFFAWGLDLDDSQQVLPAAEAAIVGDNPVILVPRRLRAECWPDAPSPPIAIADLIEFDGGTLAIDWAAVVSGAGRATSDHSVEPIPTPAGTTWDHLTLRIIDDEHVEVVAGERQERRRFDAMGMLDRRKKEPEPNSAWTLLLILARNHGELSWSDSGASDNARAHMKLLRGALRAVFPGLDGDPIGDYKKDRRWKTRFVLTDLRH